MKKQEQRLDSTNSLAINLGNCFAPLPFPFQYISYECSSVFGEELEVRKAVHNELNMYY